MCLAKSSILKPTAKRTEDDWGTIARNEKAAVDAFAVQLAYDTE